MQSLNTWLAIAQFVMVFIAIPLYRTMKNQEAQNSRLEAIIVDQQKQIKNQQVQIELLEAIVFESLDAEIIRKHILRRGEHAKH